jgi:hypothetical protein
MGVGESVYYHCTSKEGGYAMHTQFTDSPPLQTPCGPPFSCPYADFSIHVIFPPSFIPVHTHGIQVVTPAHLLSSAYLPSWSVSQ